jgi:adenylate cyclase
LFVIARNSSFTYKGRSVDVKQVGRELGVRGAASLASAA